MKNRWIPAFAGMTASVLCAAAAWAIVAAPGDVVPLRLLITSGGAGVTGLKPKVEVVRQDGAVLRSWTTMVPADGLAGDYGVAFTCPASAAHYTAYYNNTGIYAYTDTEQIDVRPAASGGTAYVNVTGINAYLASQHGSGLWGSSVAGSGSVLVDCTTDPKLIMSSSDGKNGGFTVRVYLTSDWSAGRKTNNYVQAWTTTRDDGTFSGPVALYPGISYTFVWTKPGYAVVTQAVTK